MIRVLEIRKAFMYIFPEDILLVVSKTDFKKLKKRKKIIHSAQNEEWLLFGNKFSDNMVYVCSI